MRTLVALTTWLALAGTLAAQDYPNRTIKMLVPYPAGGITDALPRIMMETCRETDTALNR